MPDKFLLAGHSYGGYICSLFACRNPDRVSALFLNSPVGHESVPEDFDEIPIRCSAGLQAPYTGYILNFWKRQWDAQRTILDWARYLPMNGLNYAVRKAVEDDLEGFPQ